MVKKIKQMLCWVKFIYFWDSRMDYKKKKLDKLSFNNSYEEIDTRLATGWYVDCEGKNKKKKFKTKEVIFKIAKKN